MSDSNPFSHAHQEIQSEKYVVFADSQRRFVACSPGVCELLGYSENEMRSLTIDHLSVFTVDVPAVFGRFVKQGAMDGLYLLRHKNGHPITIGYKAWLLNDGCLAAVWEPADQWQQAYHAALLELNPLRAKIACQRALAEIEFHRAAAEKDGTASDALRSELNHAVAALLQRLRYQV